MIQLHECIDRIATMLVPNARASGQQRSLGQSEISLMKPHMLKDVDLSAVLTGRGEFMCGNDVSPEVIWPINVCIGHLFEDGSSIFSSMRTVDRRAIRGRVNVVSKNMIRHDLVDVMPNGLFESSANYMTYIRGRKKWVSSLVTSGRIRGDGRFYASSSSLADDDDSARVEAHIGVALEQYYQWSVVIGVPGGASIKFVTTANGVKQMLKERDKSETGRRDALKAWISEHWRRNKWNEDEEIYVRKHLRGGETFKWRGFECKWLPAQDALRENDKMRIERSLMGDEARRLA